MGVGRIFGVGVFSGVDVFSTGYSTFPRVPEGKHGGKSICIGDPIYSFAADRVMQCVWTRINQRMRIALDLGT